MLLKLKDKPVLKYFRFKLVLLLCSVVWSASAEQAVNRDWQVHGFVAQGLINVNGSNFVNNNGDLSAELTEVGINASYQLFDKVRLSGQLVYLDGGNRYSEGARIDYALIDWSAYTSQNWQINLYLGRFKNNHWLYSGTRDVPFTRPSIILPQSIYFDGFRDIAVGADGLALKISYSSDNYGDFDFNLSKGNSNISDEQTQIILSKGAQGDFEQTYDVQASLYWQPFDSSWRFGLALLDSDFQYNASEENNEFFIDSDITLQRVILNTLFEGEQWEFSAELFQERFVLDGFYPLPEPFYNDQVGIGGFAQTRYKVDNKFTLLARYERFYANKDDKSGVDLEKNTAGVVPTYFAYQHDLTVGFSYDFAERVRLQFEYHNIQGTARLTPVVAPNKKINDQEYWSLWAIQLMYWF